MASVKRGLRIKASCDHFAEDGIALLTQLLVVVSFHVLLEVAHVAVLGVANGTNMLIILTVSQDRRHSGRVNV